jgi:hypothetical protein
LTIFSDIKKAVDTTSSWLGGATSSWRYGGAGGQYPSPKEVNQLLHQPGSEIGIYGGRFALPGYIIDEWLDKLSGRQEFLCYREMYDMNPVVASTINVYKMYFRAVNWYVLAAGDSKEDEEAKEFLESCMQDMYHDWQSFMAEVSSMFVFGFAPFEIVYKIRDGKVDDDKGDWRNSSQFDDRLIGWQKFAIRGQQTMLHWDYDPLDPTKLIGLTQIAAPYYNSKFIPRKKLLLFVTEPNRNLPTGRSPLRSAFKSYYQMKYLEDISNIIIEHGGLGILKGTEPPENAYYWDVDDDGKITVNEERKKNHDTFLATLQSARIGNGGAFVTVPAVYDKDGHKLCDIELLSANTGGLVSQITARLEKLAYNIMLTVNAEMLALGSGAGSFALSQDKTSRFTVAISCYADAVQGVINAQAVSRLFEQNPKFKSLKKLPEIRHKAVAPIKNDEVARMLTAMVGSGFTIGPHPDIINALLEAMGLPQVPEEDLKAMIEEDKQIKLQSQQLQQQALAQGQKAKPEEDKTQSDENPVDDTQPKGKENLPEVKKPGVVGQQAKSFRSRKIRNY